jgi:hypothetical protein
MHREEYNSINHGRGGSWPRNNINVLGYDRNTQTLFRTGVGTGTDFTGYHNQYSSSSHSSSLSSSSSSFSSSSSCSHSLSSSSCSSFNSGGDVDTNGAVFVTDVDATGAGNVGDKVFDADGFTLQSFSTDTDLLTVSFLAFTGYTHYKPRLTINGDSIPLENYSLSGAGQWTGTVEIDLNGSSEISVEHEDNPEAYTVDVSVASGAEVTDLTFTGDYPGSQTELKSGDTFDISFTTDVACDRVEVYDHEACVSDTEVLVAGTSHTISVTIADRGSGTVSEQTVRIRCRNASNSFWGDPAVATDFHTGDGTGTVELNNDYPVISSIGQSDIDYPASQEALKDAESATVNHTVSFPTGTGTVAYDSPNSQLSITNSSTYEAAKSVSRIDGSYNVSTNNFRVVATKTTNAAETTRQGVVYISNVAPTINISSPTRLRSGGNQGTSAQNHTITIVSSQDLIESPTLSADIGTFQGGGFTGGPTSWTRSLQIHDDDSKGTGTFSSLVATSLSGIEQNTINSGDKYTVGGFVERTLTIDSWPNRETNIGTQVSDTAKLECENLSKGGDGPNGGTVFTYDADTDNEVDKFTITEPTGVANPTGNLWYNKDEANAVSNTGGSAQVILEEVV